MSCLSKKNYLENCTHRIVTHEKTVVPPGRIQPVGPLLEKIIPGELRLFSISLSWPFSNGAWRLCTPCWARPQSAWRNVTRRQATLTELVWLWHHLKHLFLILIFHPQNIVHFQIMTFHEWQTNIQIFISWYLPHQWPVVMEAASRTAVLNDIKQRREEEEALYFYSAQCLLLIQFTFGGTSDCNDANFSQYFFPPRLRHLDVWHQATPIKSFSGNSVPYCFGCDSN